MRRTSGVLLKQKMKQERARSVSSTRELTIRCGANLLPIKGLLYAMSHAKANRHIGKSSSKEVQTSVRKLLKQIKEITFIASELQKLRDVGGEYLYRSIKDAASSYVDIFYDLSEEERNSYLESCNGNYVKKYHREQNLLMIPAIMASKGEPKTHVTTYLANAIYKIPFRVLYHSSKAAMHIELLEQAMGVKSAPDALMKGFSAYLGKIDRRLIEIDEGKIMPDRDEHLKQDFIEEAITLSDDTEMRISDFMLEKVLPNAFSDRTARRIIRKL